jgi:hypothetical protein
MEAMLNLHSGFENPVWTLDKEEMDELRRRLDLAEAIDPPDATEPPLTAILLTNTHRHSLMPEAIDLGRGLLVMKRGRSSLWFRDSGDVAGWLQSVARQHGFSAEP